jgi:energy-coupling factor transport system permease protein
MMGDTLFYRRLASPLHATRASVGAAWTATLIVTALACESPFVLGCLVGAIVAAGVAAGVGRQVARSLRMAAIVALPIVVVNVLVSRDGLTVFVRLGDLGPFGQGNLTVEALVYGVVIALKVSLLMLATTLGSLAVDPDELLRGVRRLSFRSALTASLATRMVPVLAGDARRLAEAQRTRPTRARGEGRLTQARAQGALVSAILSSSLDRSMDVAATLELRGFAEARRAQRRPIPWSRHDLAFATSAVVVATLALAARLAGVASFEAYPEIKAAGASETVVLAVALALAILAPLANRKGIEP